MKKNLTLKETIFVASMLFGMFFGAGNLIFPASMGQLAGERMWLAAVGFLITGVGLPLLGVAALGISRKDGLLEVSSQVGKRYGICFIFDNRTLFRDPTLCDGCIFSRRRADVSGK